VSKAYDNYELKSNATMGIGIDNSNVGSASGSVIFITAVKQYWHGSFRWTPSLRLSTICSHEWVLQYYAWPCIFSQHDQKWQRTKFLLRWKIVMFIIMTL